MTEYTRNQRRSYGLRMWKRAAQWLAGMMPGCPWEDGRPCPEHGECGQCWLSAALGEARREARREAKAEGGAA